jgi:thymidylate synthase
MKYILDQRMNKLDEQYQALLQDIIDNGVTKQDRTGTGTISVFGRQIRHKMSEGFPLITTKKMYFKGIVTELLWFLRGDTNIKFLVDNNCHIWDGDAYKNYKLKHNFQINQGIEILSQEEFINKIKTDDEFAKKWGELGPIYGKQWRNWKFTDKFTNGEQIAYVNGKVDQIANLINDLKTNPDSRRIMVNAWNVGEIDQMTLPPCHYGFQVYTRELSLEERLLLADKINKEIRQDLYTYSFNNPIYTGGIDQRPDDVERHDLLSDLNIPTRAISLMWNQRSVDTFLGLPFNIASYGLLLEIIAKAVNMVPDELIGNLGDVHLYSNHIEQAKEQIGDFYPHSERAVMLKEAMGETEFNNAVDELMPFGGGMGEFYESYNIPRMTRQPFPLPTLNINTEFWPTESGECGESPLDAAAIFEGFTNEHFCRCLIEEDIQLINYQSHPAIKAPLSN